jgi:hypothetical protein
MRTTTNLGLTVWDQGTDPFDRNQLAANWDAVDADYTRGRPASSVSPASSLPGSPVEGQLVYLTANNGGFNAGTIVRYSATGGWKPIGPFEIMSTVPSSGNYAGRLVLLSATASGFPAWSLIRFDGSAWAQANKGVDISTVVPTSGNYAGRVVVLSAVDPLFTQFVAWDVIRYDGTNWAKIGPQPIPPGTELAYTTITTDTTTTNTVQPGDQLFAFPTATFENVKYYFHFVIPNLRYSLSGNTVFFSFRESGLVTPTVIADIPSAGVGVNINIIQPFTPTAGAHTYSFNWWINSAGTGTIKATNFAAAVFRIFKA